MSSARALDGARTFEMTESRDRVFANADQRFFVFVFTWLHAPPPGGTEDARERRSTSFLRPISKKKKKNVFFASSTRLKQLALPKVQRLQRTKHMNC